jgi:hypothetical protein
MGGLKFSKTHPWVPIAQPRYNHPTLSKPIAEETNEANSDSTSPAPSIFSAVTGDSISDTSVDSVIVFAAEEQLIAFLASDENLGPIYRAATTKLSPQRFERNFARLLELYAQDLRSEAVDDMQNQAVHLVRSRRHPTARALRQKFFLFSKMNIGYTRRFKNRQSTAPCN